MNEKSEMLLALTFDDGPNTSTTVSVIEMLKKHDIVASFFLVGNLITDETAKIIKTAFDMGCDIENHSKTHSYMNEMTSADISSEIEFTSNKIELVIGKRPSFFRPPYIAVNKVMYESTDLVFIAGHDCQDWDDTVSSDERVSLILDTVKDGSVILMHDMLGNTKTVEALDKLIPMLKLRGYRFVTISELFRMKNTILKHGLVYNGAFEPVCL